MRTIPDAWDSAIPAVLTPAPVRLSPKQEPRTGGRLPAAIEREWLAPERSCALAAFVLPLFRSSLRFSLPVAPIANSWLRNARHLPILNPRRKLLRRALRI